MRTPEDAVLDSVLVLLRNLSAENESPLFNRWPINHEPLRADARRLLPELEKLIATRQAQNEQVDADAQEPSAAGAAYTVEAVRDVLVSWGRDAVFPSGSDVLDAVNWIARPTTAGEPAAGGVAQGADDEADDLRIDNAFLRHCLAINVEPVVRMCVTGVVGLSPETAETLVEHLTARLHDAIRPASLKAALSPRPQGEE